MVQVEKIKKDYTPRQPKTKTIYKENPEHKEAYDFLNRNQDVLFKALFNVRNTIKNKKEVIAKDFSKTYYRDYLKYSYVITEMKELFDIKEEAK